MSIRRAALQNGMAIGLTLAVAVGARAQQIPYPALAKRIVTALAVQKGERVLLRYDAKTLGPLLPEVTRQLEATGAVVASLAYGPAPDFAERLARTDIYIWLPAGEDAVTPADQRAILAKWLDAGGGRQIHFHWNDGTRDADGLPVTHTAAYDAVYVKALDIDYAALSRRQDEAIALLRSGDVHVTTPDGTDLRFRVGDRPFNKQDGDASKARMAQARVRVDREVELPAGVLRVAPIESSVNGVLVIPKARLGAAVVTAARLEIRAGVVTKASAANGDEVLQAFLKSAPGASSFREFGRRVQPEPGRSGWRLRASVLRLRRRGRSTEPRRQRGDRRHRARRRRALVLLPEHDCHRGDDDAGERRETVEGLRVTRLSGGSAYSQRDTTCGDDILRSAGLPA